MAVASYGFGFLNAYVPASFAAGTILGGLAGMASRDPAAVAAGCTRGLEPHAELGFAAARAFAVRHTTSASGSDLQLLAGEIDEFWTT
jgi:hypothetical protein